MNIAIAADVLRHIEELVAETVLPAAAWNQYQSGRITREALMPYARLIQDFSKRYIARDRRGAVPAKTPQEAAAYSLYYLVPNAAKLLRLFAELPQFPGGISLLDVGCGPGTASLAASLFFRNDLNIEATEISRPSRSLASQLLSRAGSRRDGALEFRCGENVTGGSFDLIIAANIVNELTTVKEILGLSNRLKDHGFLMLLEPALKDTTRQLMTIRNHLLENGAALQVLFPCTRADSCPMLQKGPDDWCHGEIREGRQWDRTPLLRQLDALLGFNKHSIKYAAFVFQKHGTLREGYRVIRTPKSKKHPLLWLCGPDLYGLTAVAPSVRKESLRLSQYERITATLKEAAVTSILRCKP